MSTETQNKNSGGPTVFGVIGWIGTLLVFASVGIRFLRPEWAQYQQYAAWAGLALVLVYIAGQWRDIAEFYKGRSAKYGTLPMVSVLVFAGILVRRQLPGVAAEQAVGPHRQPGLQPVGSDHQDHPEPRRAGEDDGVRPRARARRLPRPAGRLLLPLVERHRRSTSTRRRTRCARRRREIQSLGTILIEYKDRTERVTSSDEQAIANALIKAVTGETRKVYFTQGHGEKDTASSDRTGYSAIAPGAGPDNYGVDKVVLRADARGARRRHRAGHRRAADRLPAARDRRHQEVRGQGRQGAGDGRPAGGPRRHGPARPGRLPAEWGFNVGNEHRRRCQRHRPAARHRRVGAGGGQLSAAPDHHQLPADDGVSAGALGGRGGRRRRRPHAAAAGPDQRAELGRSRHRRARRRRRTGGAQRRQGRQGRADLARRGGVGAGDRRARPPSRSRNRSRPAREPTASPSRAWSCIGDSDFAQQRHPGRPGQPRLLPEQRSTGWRSRRT